MDSAHWRFGILKFGLHMVSHRWRMSWTIFSNYDARWLHLLVAEYATRLINFWMGGIRNLNFCSGCRRTNRSSGILCTFLFSFFSAKKFSNVYIRVAFSEVSITTGVLIFSFFFHIIHVHVSEPIPQRLYLNTRVYVHPFFFYIHGSIDENVKGMRMFTSMYKGEKKRENDAFVSSFCGPASSLRTIHSLVCPSIRAFKDWGTATLRRLKWDMRIRSPIVFHVIEIVL